MLYFEGGVAPNEDNDYWYCWRLRFGQVYLYQSLEELFGENITVIYHDNYYRANDDLSMEERRKINYDHPQALETDLLVQHLEALKAGESIKCPVYDFTQHNRSDKTITIHPSRVIVVEGILIFQDERLRDAFDIKIFVEADADERILRRVVRDMDERGRELQDIIEHYLATVKPMHYLYVEPTRNVADIVLNSGLNDVAFDVMKTKIERILENPDED